MKVLVIDGQGGGIGRALVSEIKNTISGAEIIAIGTNSAATGAMLKAGAHHAATGENAIIVNCKKCDVIAGPVGIVTADSLMGEITPEIAVAVGRSHAKKVLIPVNNCNVSIAGVTEMPISGLVTAAVRIIAAH